jgi:hypothetical protein
MPALRALAATVPEQGGCVACRGIFVDFGPPARGCLQ